MKTLSPELLAHYQGPLHTLARLLKVIRLDGQVFGFTDHQQAITYASLTYAASSVFDASSIASKSDLSVGNLEVKGLLDHEGITDEDIEAGLWSGARFELIEVNYRDLTMGHNPLRRGAFGEVQHEGLNYSVELRDLSYKLKNNIGRIVTPACDANVGDARCGIDLEALRVSGVVTSSEDARNFAASALTQDGGYFSRGKITWTTGANAGRSMEVNLHTTGGVFALELKMFYPILPGDEFTVTPGCDRTKATCKDKYDNVVNFRGFSFVPGPIKTMLVGGQ